MNEMMERGKWRENIELQINACVCHDWQERCWPCHCRRSLLSHDEEMTKIVERVTVSKVKEVGYAFDAIDKIIQEAQSIVADLLGKDKKCKSRNDIHLAPPSLWRDDGGPASGGRFSRG